jgi:peptidoglycan/LPS O-acetylase OafA/YrhL
VIRTVAEALGARDVPRPPAVLAALVMLVLSLGVAWLLHRFVELPTFRLLTRKRTHLAQAV